MLRRESNRGELAVIEIREDIGHPEILRRA